VSIFYSHPVTNTGGEMGLFDRDKKNEEKAGKKKADFSNVQGGSSSKATTPEMEAQGRTYTVRGGDSLWKISEEMYGDGNQWNRIYEANRNRIKDPDVIQPGWVLTIPSATETKGDER
jgi:nucleoid-associated protein YgaU